MTAETVVSHVSVWCHFNTQTYSGMPEWHMRWAHGCPFRGPRKDRLATLSSQKPQGKGSSGAGVFSAPLASFCHQCEYSCADLVLPMLQMSAIMTTRQGGAQASDLGGRARLTW
ncbi:hypothetical protein SCOCK_140008 [Actinacidiphila cocklensis]|uniref:Uncharacterized protein n=1 Tax=Actinacidiphila cocklensis TaxID=887465 RepID=A0A9W4DKT5_9ACTN|nr:hypothetical protein SCOCK_140008 [Actinacidiphila cocklensis]